MKTNVEILLVEALKLRTDERRELLAALQRSLDVGETRSAAEAWRHEVARRRIALDSGAIDAVPWADAKARLKRL